MFLCLAIILEYVPVAQICRHCHCRKQLSFSPSHCFFVSKPSDGLLSHSEERKGQFLILDLKAPWSLAPHLHLFPGLCICSFLSLEHSSHPSSYLHSISFTGSGFSWSSVLLPLPLPACLSSDHLSSPAVYLLFWFFSPFLLLTPSRM